MHDSVPSTRAGFMIWDLLLRNWSGIGGATTKQCSDRIGLTWEGTHALLAGLARCEVLPVTQEELLWTCGYHPRSLTPVVGATPTQRAGLVAHRLICRGLFRNELSVRAEQVSMFVDLDYDAAIRLLSRLSDAGGIPLWCDDYDESVWFIDLCQFRAFLHKEV